MTFAPRIGAHQPAPVTSRDRCDSCELATKVGRTADEAERGLPTNLPRSANTADQAANKAAHVAYERANKPASKERSMDAAHAEALLQSFKLHLHAEGKSAHTIRGYLAGIVVG